MLLRWASNLNFIKILRTLETAWFQRFLRLWGVEMGKIKITVFAEKLVKIWYERKLVKVFYQFRQAKFAGFLYREQFTKINEKEDENEIC